PSLADLRVLVALTDLLLALRLELRHLLALLLHLGALERAEQRAVHLVRGFAIAAELVERLSEVEPGQIGVRPSAMRVGCPSLVLPDVQSVPHLLRFFLPLLLLLGGEAVTEIGEALETVLARDLLAARLRQTLEVFGLALIPLVLAKAAREIEIAES